MERFVSGHALLRVSLLVMVLMAIISATQVSLSGTARASVSQSWHQLPWSGKAGVTPSARCANASPGYGCTLGGYGAWIAHPSGWAWQYYGGSNPSYNAYGPHNCTLYVAYRLQETGVTLTWSANGSAWAYDAASHGASVNQTPSVGAVAQWNVGHVAYVEAVTPKYILITADNFQPYDVGTLPGGFTDSYVIARNSPAMPDNFIHFSAPTVPLAAYSHTS
jgi:surface antigen